jgi:tetratricopeptide (TPR) repeat protein
MRFVILIPGSLILLAAIAVIGASRETPDPKTLYPMPEGAEEFLRRGELYEDAGNYEEALSDYEQAALLEPDNSDVYLEQGSVLAALDQPEAAIEKYLIVKEIDQKNGVSTRIVEDLIALEKEKL